MAPAQSHALSTKQTRGSSSSVLDALTTAEHSVVLAAVLSAHPDLAAEAEDEALRLITATTVDGVAADMSATLRTLSLEQLATRSGTGCGRGYVHETEAAWELVEEAVEPFLVDMRRRTSLGLADAAAAVATGIVAGLYRVNPPDDGTVLAHAGPDVLRELADAVLDEAERLGLEIESGEAGTCWPGWDQRG